MQMDYHAVHAVFSRFQASEPEPKGELHHVNAFTLVPADFPRTWMCNRHQILPFVIVYDFDVVSVAPTKLEAFLPRS